VLLVATPDSPASVVYEIHQIDDGLITADNNRAALELQIDVNYAANIFRVNIVLVVCVCLIGNMVW
jgi:hypothetical protein